MANTQNTQPCDCKTCMYGTPLFERDRTGRFDASYKAYPKAACSKPKYKGKVYLVNALRKSGCVDYHKRAYQSGETQ